MRRDTCVVVTRHDADGLENLAATFHTDYYQNWTDTDFIGIEVWATTKNCYALGIGFMENV